jgi:hypothetical protein
LLFVTKKDKKKYLEKFWVGLMDGDGSIQVNHWRKKNLQFRLVIKLKNTIANKKLLQILIENIGGVFKESELFVIWVENTKHKIVNLIEIFERYPPLTQRLQYKLEFLKQMLVLNKTDDKTKIMKIYFEQRTIKWYTNIVARNPNILISLPYYNEWLSGFIEAEGCFSIRTNTKTVSFSIGQKFEKDLLLSIGLYFETIANVNLRKNSDNFYFLETYNKTSLRKINTHFQNYPLIGEKANQFIKFSIFINQRK